MTALYGDITQVLKVIHSRFGEEIFSDHARFASALSDLVTGAEAGKVKNMLRIAICDLRAYSRLKKAKATGDNFAALNIAKEMTDDFMLPIEISTGVINCVAVLVGFQTESAPQPIARPVTIAAHPQSTAQATGNTVRFGKRDWRVLEVQSGSALLLSDKLAEKHPYHDKLEKVTWEQCSLRRYLNVEFYSTFTKAEQARILKTKRPNPKNHWFGTTDGNETTEKIFLLSIDDLIKYFGESNQLHGKTLINKSLIDDRFNNARKATDTEGSPAWWWTRSSGEDADFAAYVGTSGEIHMDGFLVNIAGGVGGGVRPAMWLNLSKT